MHGKGCELSPCQCFVRYVIAVMPQGHGPATAPRIMKSRMLRKPRCPLDCRPKFTDILIVATAQHHLAKSCWRGPIQSAKNFMGKEYWEINLFISPEYLVMDCDFDPIWVHREIIHLPEISPQIPGNVSQMLASRAHGGEPC